MNEPKPIYLSSIEVDQEVEVIGFVQGGRIAHRLAELGITPRTRLTVLQSRPGQPLQIRVRGSHLAIDRAIADRLQVRQFKRKHHRRRHQARRGSRGHRFRRIQVMLRGTETSERPRGQRKRPGHRRPFRRRFLEHFLRRQEAENGD